MASAGTAGVQVVAVLFAVRVGYKLARSAGRVLFEAPSSVSESSGSEDEQQQALEDLGAEGDDGVCAREQWVLCCDPLPEAPEGARLMASEHLPISVYHFYEQFLSVEATCLQDHHRSTGQMNFRASRWKGDGAGHFSRTFEFVQPKKGIASAPAACVQEQRFSVHAGGMWAMTSDMSMSGIPYGDSFRVQSFWKAAPDATGLGCHVSVHVAVPFSKRCMVKGLITGATFKDCQSFFSDFLAKVQNSIATELLPAAAAQAAAAEQLLGSSPAAAAAALNSHLPQPPPLLLTPTNRGTPTVSSSPFASVDAEVFVSTPLQAGGSAPQRSKRNRGGRAAHGWFQWPKQQQQHHKPGKHRSQQPQQHSSTAAESADVLRLLGERGSAHAHGQQQQQQWPALPSPSSLRGGSGGQQQQHHHHHHHGRSSSRSQTPTGRMPAWPPSRAVSVKPSFGLPIDDLRLPNRVRPAEFISTAQAILLLLVLVVQLITLYDNMVLRRLLALTEPLPEGSLGLGGLGGHL